MTFVRTIEDFTCEQCGVAVRGDGFTNHCPSCLWSKHVDIEPGDRLETCGGMMRPIALEGSAAQYRILYKCEKCGMRRRVRTDSKDSQTALLSLAGTGAR